MNNVLLIQLFSNGDCLYATTIAKQIKQDYPQCKLSWLVFPNIAPILKLNPYIDELIYFEKIVNETNGDLYIRVINYVEDLVKKGSIDTYYFPQLISDNFSNFDGCLRRSMYRCYPRQITVDKTAILQIDDNEKAKAVQFANEHKLSSYKNVILFEASPMSGQVLLTEDNIKTWAASLADLESTCVITSSFKSFNIDHPHVFDGSVLSIRETAALTHYCTILLGCSSGITWITLTTAAKRLPLVQVLDAKAYIFNPPSIDFTVSGFNIENVIELYNVTNALIIEIFSQIFTFGFEKARLNHNQIVKNKFTLHRGIIHDFLKRGKYKLISKFIGINVRQHGFNLNMLIKILMGFTLFPIQLIVDAIKNKSAH
jgi:hypothetical protein